MKALSVALALTVLLICQSFACAQIQTPQETPPADDHESVFRLHPDLKTVRLLVVPPAEIKPGYVYSYYNAKLKERVWGLALEGGKFQYAFGETTTIPTNKFDLRLSPEMQQRVLNERSPRLLQELNTVGRSAAVRLSTEGVWNLLPFASSARVFDMETGKRWEWHGLRRLAVVHTMGDLWHVVDGKFYPITIMASLCQ